MIGLIYALVAIGVHVELRQQKSGFWMATVFAVIWPAMLGAVLVHRFNEVIEEKETPRFNVVVDAEILAREHGVKHEPGERFDLCPKCEEKEKS